MFIQISPACVIFHTLASSSFSSFPLSFSVPDLWGAATCPRPRPSLYPTCTITHFSFSSLEISIYFCLVYYLHIAHNLCLLISRAILYLHSLPASCPIFLLSAPFISLSVSQRLLITTLLILSLPPHPSSHHLAQVPASLLSRVHSFIHIER